MSNCNAMWRPFKLNKRPERNNTTCVWYPLDAPNSWIFAATQKITLTYVCGVERGKVQVLKVES